MNSLDYMHMEYGQIHRPFGPIVYQQEISDDLFEELKDKIYKTDHVYRKHLAGNIVDERGLNGMLSEEAIKELDERHGLYLAAYFGKPVEKRFDYMPQVELESIWVNFMKAFEWNPPHEHTGALSFVIYIDNPVDDFQELQHETQKESNAPSAGKIMFRYGENHPFSRNKMYMRPKAKDILIFPAWLEHQVFQFTQDVTRISVAGNYRMREEEPQRP